jgi:hypothetical protein
MKISEDETIQKIDEDASEEKRGVAIVDEIIAHHVANEDYYPANHAAKSLRHDGKLKAHETEVFILATARDPGFLGKRFPFACQMAKEHHASKEIIEWIALNAAKHGSTEGLGLALRLLNRKATIEELEELRNAIIGPKKKK